MCVFYRGSSEPQRRKVADAAAPQQALSDSQKIPDGRGAPQFWNCHGSTTTLPLDYPSKIHFNEAYLMFILENVKRGTMEYRGGSWETHGIHVVPAHPPRASTSASYSTACHFPCLMYRGSSDCPGCFSVMGQFCDRNRAYCEYLYSNHPHGHHFQRVPLPS